jgi:hypothetical protein
VWTRRIILKIRPCIISTPIISLSSDITSVNSISLIDNWWYKLYMDCRRPIDGMSRYFIITVVIIAFIAAL